MDNHFIHSAALQVGMTKTDAAVQTLSDINPDVVLEVTSYRLHEMVDALEDYLLQLTLLSMAFSFYHVNNSIIPFPLVGLFFLLFCIELFLEHHNCERIRNICGKPQKKEFTNACTL